MKKATNGRRHRERFPEFALSVRQLREKCALSQPRLAADLGVKRGAVARWEAGTREPNEENYARLADFAHRGKLKLLEDFFSSQLEAKKRIRIMELEHRDAVHFSRAVQQMAKAGGRYGRRLVELYRLTFADYIREQVHRIVSAHKTLSNGAFNEEITKMVEELLHVTELSVPGGLDMYRELVGLQRQLDRLYTHTADTPQAHEAKRQEIERTLERWAALVRDGKIPGPNDLGKGIAEGNILKVLCAKVSGIAQEKSQGDEQGKPFDSGEFIKKLERALEIDRKTGKSNGQF